MAKVEISPEMLAQMISQAVAAALANAQAERKEAYVKGLPDKWVKTEAAVAKAFQKAGYKDIVLYDRTKTLAEQPNVTILTYQKWYELGRKVKTGEKALKIRGYHLRLFHKSQTEIATVEERKANFAKMQEAIKRHEAKKNGGTASMNA